MVKTGLLMQEAWVGSLVRELTVQYCVANRYKTNTFFFLNGNKPGQNNED